MLRLIVLVVFVGFYGAKLKSNYDVIVVRVNQKGELCSSNPCIMCMDYMYHAGVRRVHFSDSSGEIKTIVVKNYIMESPDVQISHGVRYFVENYGHMSIRKLPVSIKTYKFIIRKCRRK